MVLVQGETFLEIPRTKPRTNHQVPSSVIPNSNSRIPNKDKPTSLAIWAANSNRTNTLLLPVSLAIMQDSRTRLLACLVTTLGRSSRIRLARRVFLGIITLDSKTRIHRLVRLVCLEIQIRTSLRGQVASLGMPTIRTNLRETRVSLAI